jgi:hypothetical protein
LKSLDVSYTNITDASLIAIAKNCTGLQYFDARECDGLSSKKLRHQFKSVSELRAVLLSIYPICIPPLMGVMYDGDDDHNDHDDDNNDDDDGGW